jgi:AAA domain
MTLLNATRCCYINLYIGGEAGTGKSRIVKAVIIALSLLQRDAEIALMAPTGSAADNIDGNTYHTALGMSIGKKNVSYRPETDPTPLGQ